MNKLELVSRGDQKMQKIKYVFIFCFSYFCFLIASLSLIGWKKFLSQWFWQFSARSYSACKKCTIKAHQSAICQNFVSWQNLVPILYDVIEFNYGESFRYKVFTICIYHSTSKLKLFYNLYIHYHILPHAKRTFWQISKFLKDSTAFVYEVQTL